MPPLTEGTVDQLTGIDDLEYLRTVDRTLLHRWALSEVFLTDARRVDDTRFLAAAQLPPTHPYYTDHLVHDGRVPDPLLLIECCRQAETYAAHVFHDVPRDAKFILRSWSWRGLGPAAVLPPGPARLAVQVSTVRPQYRGSELRGLEYHMDLWLGGAPVGAVRLEASYLSAPMYEAARSHVRGRTPAPRSDTHVAPDAGPEVAPHLVGRTDPRNVVLGDARTDGRGGATARLRVPADHPSMFDHPLDHVPGMVLMEAARQLALFTANDRRGSLSRQAVTAFSATFTTYVELDAPVSLEAVPIDADPAGGTAVRVSVRQNGVEAAAVTVELGDALPAGE